MSLSGQDGGAGSGGGGRRKLVSGYGKGVGGKGSRKRYPKGGDMASPIVTEELLSAQRSALIVDKYAELDTVNDRHDTLVCFRPTTFHAFAY